MIVTLNKRDELHAFSGKRGKEKFVLDKAGDFTLGSLQFAFAELAKHPSAGTVVGSFKRSGRAMKYAAGRAFEATHRSSVEGKESWKFVKSGQEVALEEGDVLEFRITSANPAETFYVSLAVEGFETK